MIDMRRLTSQNHHTYMREAVVEGSGNINHLGFFNVHPNLSTRAYSIFAFVENATTSTAGIRFRDLRIALSSHREANCSRDEGEGEEGLSPRIWADWERYFRCPVCDCSSLQCRALFYAKRVQPISGGWSGLGGCLSLGACRRILPAIWLLYRLLCSVRPPHRPREEEGCLIQLSSCTLWIVCELGEAEPYGPPHPPPFLCEKERRNRNATYIKHLLDTDRDCCRHLFSFDTQRARHCMVAYEERAEPPSSNKSACFEFVRRGATCAASKRLSTAAPYELRACRASHLSGFQRQAAAA
ncbi:hypothetical protein HPB51_029639 [Rhipicephalus microplus]|uniref:Uncharacterized protein n=1 Tax=Rhipicephalus microplus TaxID=6941 RepID=A0A9J6CTT0_RHIMP|nr:hypothetical protein HPB51_029639 [Rhipicephalus microplus]